MALPLHPAHFWAGLLVLGVFGLRDAIRICGLVVVICVAIRGATPAERPAILRALAPVVARPRRRE